MEVEVHQVSSLGYNVKFKSPPGTLFHRGQLLSSAVEKSCLLPGSLVSDDELIKVNITQ